MAQRRRPHLPVVRLQDALAWSISVVMLIRARIREWAQCYCRCVGEVEINPLKSAADATMGTRL